MAADSGAGLYTKCFAVLHLKLLESDMPCACRLAGMHAVACEAVHVHLTPRIPLKCFAHTSTQQTVPTSHHTHLCEIREPQGPLL